VYRIEGLAGPTGRRRWPDGLKAWIIAESFEPCARICNVVAKHALIAMHLSGWRGLARKGGPVMPVDISATVVPLVIKPLAAAAGESPVTGMIRVEDCGAVLHLAQDCNPKRTATIAAALRKVL